MKRYLLKAAAVMTALICLAGCGGSDSGAQSAAKGEFDPASITLTAAETVKSEAAQPSSGNTYKVEFKSDGEQNNPLITNIYCADPTSVEYNGRLYVYGTCDNQQYVEKPGESNTYEKIKSFVVISTDDMLNWRYEGIIDTKSVAPWIIASWAPSIVSRVEEDGLTHFYLYFSNSGAGVGVITSTDPVGPWSDPLGKPLIKAGMEGLGDCPSPFDPGAVIDDEGVGWLAFGGGVAKEGSAYMPGTSRICRLGSDMVSVDSEIAEIKAPYFFEASELNFINGTYVYTFNTSWENRTEWDYSTGIDSPGACSMCYMTSKTPLETDSWEYRGMYLKNPGEMGMGYSNNHTHLQKYKDNYYVLFHTMLMQSGLKRKDLGMRSLCADTVEVDEETVTISRCEATAKAPLLTAASSGIDVFSPVQAETSYLCDCEYVTEGDVTFAHCEDKNLIAVKKADLGDGARAFAARLRGKGTVTVRFDSMESEPAAELSCDSTGWKNIYTELTASGEKELIFLELSGGLDMDEWQLVK